MILPLAGGGPSIAAARRSKSPRASVFDGRPTWSTSAAGRSYALRVRADSRSVVPAPSGDCRIEIDQEVGVSRIDERARPAWIGREQQEQEEASRLPEQRPVGVELELAGPADVQIDRCVRLLVGESDDEIARELLPRDVPAPVEERGDDLVDNDRLDRELERTDDAGRERGWRRRQRRRPVGRHSRRRCDGSRQGDDRRDCERNDAIHRSPLSAVAHARARARELYSTMVD